MKMWKTVKVLTGLECIIYKYEINGAVGMWTMLGHSLLKEIFYSNRYGLIAK